MTGPILAHEDTGGDEPVVLFAHAFPLDRRMWRRQLDELRRQRVRAVAPDLRGFGASRDLPPARSIDEHADDLARLLDHLRVERAAVVGLSMGGYVAFAFARRHPNRLRGLLLADTKASPDDEAARRGRAANIERTRREGVPAVFEAMVPKVFPRDVDRMVLEELLGIASAQSPDGVVAALEAMRDRPDATPTLSTVAVPTRVVVGTADAATPPSEAESIARAIRGAILTTIDGAGHFTNVERPREFDRVLLDLVRALREDRP